MKNKNQLPNNDLISACFANIELGASQIFDNIELIPLFNSKLNGTEYLTMKEALDQSLIQISELNDEGSVSELKVINKAKKPVLLIDGEEIKGAKQNRVLNTTILLDKDSETVIPVSCTEGGRWSYTSKYFSDSDVVLSPSMKMQKSSFLNVSLGQTNRFNSDQSRIWENIDEMSSKAEHYSPTGSMRDIYDSKNEELQAYMKAIKCLPHQKGIFVLINGRVAGFDLLSNERAFTVLHDKLVKSYLMEAILNKKHISRDSSADKANRFIKDIEQTTEKKYKSVGLGWDHRFTGEGVVGSSLVDEKSVVHMAFFGKQEYYSPKQTIDITKIPYLY